MECIVIKKQKQFFHQKLGRDQKLDLKHGVPYIYRYNKNNHVINYISYTPRTALSKNMFIPNQMDFDESYQTPIF